MQQESLFIKLIAITAVAGIIGCSKSPEQSEAPRVETEKTTLDNTIANGDNSISTTEDNWQIAFDDSFTNVAELTDFEIEVVKKPEIGEDLIGGANSDDLIQENARKPIVYASGAGGITFDTTLEESTAILARPRSGPNADGEALYDEGIYVFWRTDKPRTPNFILILTSYLGKVQIPSFSKGFTKEFGINEDFSSYGVNTKEGADQLARDVYLTFHDVDADFDCLPKGHCQVGWGTPEQKNFTVQVPGLLLLLSKDRFTLFRMGVTQDIPQGILASDLDLINGRFMVEGEYPVAMGDEFQLIEDRLNIDTKTSVGSDFFSKFYSGVGLVYNKTQFSREDREPLPTNKLKAVSVSRDYKNPFSLNGEYYAVLESTSGLEILPVLSKSNEVAETSSGRLIPLQVNMQLRAEDVFSFTEQFVGLLEMKFVEKSPGNIVFSQITGEHQKRQIKEYTALVVSYDEASGDGILVEFRMSEEFGDFGYFYTSRFGTSFDPFDAMILPQAVQSITKDERGFFSQLSGFKIGDQLVLKDWDIGRGEATMTMNGLSVRVGYSQRATAEVAFNLDKTTPRDLAFVAVGSLGVQLGLTLLSEKETERSYGVISMTSGANALGLESVCDSLDLLYGMSSAEVLEQLQKKDNCGYRLGIDTGGNGRLDSIYIPAARVRLNFDGQEFVSSTMYAPESEVQSLVNEVR